MLVMREQTTISIEDIRYVSIKCRHCNSRVTIDMGKAPDLNFSRPQFAPSNCGICNEPFDSAVQRLNQFQRDYLALAEANLKERVCFITESELDREPKPGTPVRNQKSQGRIL
jgi:hypothetical protein